MLQLISGRLEKQVCDEVLETAWSTLWNVTGGLLAKLLATIPLTAHRQKVCPCWARVGGGFRPKHSACNAVAVDHMVKWIVAFTLAVALVTPFILS